MRIMEYLYLLMMEWSRHSYSHHFLPFNSVRNEQKTAFTRIIFIFFPYWFILYPLHQSILRLWLILSRMQFVWFVILDVLRCCKVEQYFMFCDGICLHMVEHSTMSYCCLFMYCNTQVLICTWGAYLLEVHTLCTLYIHSM